MTTRTRPRRTLLAALCTAAGLACDDPAASLRVQICGDLRLGADVDAIRVTVRDEDRTLTYSGLDELVLVADAGPASTDPDAEAGPDAGATCGPVLTADLALPAGEGRAWVEVQALRGGLEVGRGEVRAEAGAALVVLTRSCLGVVCPLGQTCLDAACERLPVGGDLARCEVPCAL